MTPTALTASNGDPELLPAGTAVGEYLLGDLLGVGGFARVYRARHAVLARTVAVKIINRALSLNPEATQRFVREAIAASRIDHPNIVRVLGYGEIADGRAYQVMELVDGPPLDDHLTEHGRPPVEEALRLLGAIAEALDAAHAAGIVHRDLKPANILLAPTSGLPMPRLADFGIAKALELDDDHTHLTRTGTTLGTPVYMSPEQALGRQVGPASDIYAFGVVAFELLTGEPPFEGDSALETMMSHVQASPPAPSAVVPALGTRFDEAIEWLLAKQPEHRPSNLAEAMAALRGGPTRRRPRRLWPRAALALSALVAASVVAVLAMSDRSSSPPAVPPPAEPLPAATPTVAAPVTAVTPRPSASPPPAASRTTKDAPKATARPRPSRTPAAPPPSPDSLETPPDYDP